MPYDILIVDDSATTRAMIKRTLTLAQLPMGQCFEAPDGKAALELLAVNHVDLVLADLHMPEMGGVEMTARILADERTRRIPVVVVSAEPNARRLEELKQQGVRGCVRKPFTPEMIRKVVTEILEVPHAA
jgi:two-component system, chemotaxis family, chemotaxis protein CheY